MLAGGQHGDDDLGALDRLGRALGLVGALLDRGRDGCVRQVEGDHLMLRLAEIRGHRATHVAETDEGDLRHGFLPLLPVQSKNRSFATGLKCASTIARVTPSLVGGFHLGFWSLSISSARTPSKKS